MRPRSARQVGPNNAADPIVTRYHPTSGQLQVVAIQRKDTAQWAIPGGMVDDGELVSQTVRREFEEEAGNVADRAAFQAQVSELFAAGEQVYCGYIDDPRNTDHAWTETTAFHFHCSAELGAQLQLSAGDDARDVMWLDVDAKDERYRNMYGANRSLVDRVASRCQDEWTASKWIASLDVPAIVAGALLGGMRPINELAAMRAVSAATDDEATLAERLR